MAIKDNKDGTFTIDYRDPQHRRHRQTITGSKTMAKTILTKIKADIAEGKFFPDRQKQQNVLTFWQAADKYYDIHLSKKKSGPKLKYTVEFLKKRIGDKPLNRLTTEEIQSFYNTRMAETTPSTANRHFTTLRAIINKMIQLKLYNGENPCTGVSKQKENPARTNYLARDQIKTLLDCIEDRSKNLVAFAILTGMRRGEIMRLTWQDMDLNNGIIHIYESKSGHKREVPIVPDLKNILLGMNPQLHGKVFNLTVKQIEHDFCQALAKAGIVGIRFHDLRHTFASHFMMGGGDLCVLQRILGHSDLKMTQRYAHLSPTYLCKSIEIMNHLIPQLT